MKPALLRGIPAGLTLIELLVVSSILVVVTGFLFATFAIQTQTFNRQTAQNVTQNDLRIWGSKMVQDIRRARFNPTVTSPNPFVIDTATPTQFTFYVSDGGSTLTNTDPDQCLGYRLDSNRLQRWLCGSNWRTVLSGVQNTTLFSYRNVQGAMVNTTSPYTSTDSISEVESTLSATTTTGGYPGAAAPVVSESFKATIRNPS
jgi:prepilin-type N-terminal cleavage/methylation domain-containing protein